MRPAVQYGAVELASPAALQQSIQPTGVSYPRGGLEPPQIWRVQVQAFRVFLHPFPSHDRSLIAKVTCSGRAPPSRSLFTTLPPAS